MVFEYNTEKLETALLDFYNATGINIIFHDAVSTISTYTVNVSPTYISLSLTDNVAEAAITLLLNINVIIPIIVIILIFFIPSPFPYFVFSCISIAYFFIILNIFY